MVLDRDVNAARNILAVV
ncbi:MAG: hypothetical protein JXB85_02105 [Anaerolineales bacterium]|nr:hypothetical protein [Anaerolineales bacterium]